MYDPKTESVPVLSVEDDRLVRVDTASFLEGEGFVVERGRLARLGWGELSAL
jgi:hypothetical protein